MRGTAVIQTVTALSDFLNGSFLVARLARIDPLLPATIFSANDRPTLQPDRRPRRRKSQGRRQQSFAGGNHRKGSDPG